LLLDIRAWAPIESGRRGRPGKESRTARRKQMPAKVNADECTACGQCADVCPVDAIKVDDVAVVDAETCTDCGACIDECPVDAISQG
jgi:ferredoxin